jgi:hypothetical protein
LLESHKLSSNDRLSSLWDPDSSLMENRPVDPAVKAVVFRMPKRC